MNKKSIYVSISCLGIDEELENTIKSCLTMSSGKYDINIGVCIIENFDFFIKIKNQFDKKINVRLEFLELKNNIGIGKNRKSASMLYDSEDYFLQIDAHNIFKKNWDEYLVDRFTHISNLLKSKIVLSGYMGSYKYKEDIDKTIKEFIKIDSLGFSFWEKNKFKLTNKCIPSWGHFYIGITNNKEVEEDSSKTISDIKNNGFAKLNKISANFLFGNKDIVPVVQKGSNAMFWEEEIFQSIDLVDNGFLLIHPGQYSPYLHLYSSDIKKINKKREDIYTLVNKQGFGTTQITLTMQKRYMSYMNNPDNQEKINKYIKYAGIDPRNGKIQN